MLPTETSPIPVSETPGGAAPQAALKHPWYLWLCAGVAILLPILYTILAPLIEKLPQDHQGLNALALCLTSLIPTLALVAAVGLVLRRTRAKTLLMVIGALLLALVEIGLVAAFSHTRAGYPDSDAVQSVSGILLALGAFFPAVSVWLAVLAVHRKSNRLALAALAVMGLVLCVGCAYLATILPNGANPSGIQNQ